MSGLFDAVAGVAWLVYLLTFTFMFLETAGLPLPALSFALLAASLAGSGQLNFVACVVATIMGATLGGPVGYTVGMRGGRPLLERIGGRVRLTPERLADVEAQFNKRGKAIVLGRFFVPVLPWSAGIFAGIVKMPRRTLVLYTFFSITLWALLEMTIVAYFSSVLVDLVSRFTIEGIFWLATGVVGIIILINVFRRRRAARAAGRELLSGAEDVPEQLDLQSPTEPTMDNAVHGIQADSAQPASDGRLPAQDTEVSAVKDEATAYQPEEQHAPPTVGGPAGTPPPISH